VIVGFVIAPTARKLYDDPDLTSDEVVRKKKSSDVELRITFWPTAVSVEELTLTADDVVNAFWKTILLPRLVKEALFCMEIVVVPVEQAVRKFAFVIVAVPA
jgi:hypothetical protein